MEAESKSQAKQTTALKESVLVRIDSGNEVTDLSSGTDRKAKSVALLVLGLALALTLLVALSPASRTSGAAVAKMQLRVQDKAARVRAHDDTPLMDKIKARVPAAGDLVIQKISLHTVWKTQEDSGEHGVHLYKKDQSDTIVAVCTGAREDAAFTEPEPGRIHWIPYDVLKAFYLEPPASDTELVVMTATFSGCTFFAYKKGRSYHIARTYSPTGEDESTGADIWKAISDKWPATTEKEIIMMVPDLEDATLNLNAFMADGAGAYTDKYDRVRNFEVDAKPEAVDKKKVKARSDVTRSVVGVRSGDFIKFYYQEKVFTGHYSDGRGETETVHGAWTLLPYASRTTKAGCDSCGQVECAKWYQCYIPNWPDWSSWSG